jgi:hypothetical protein
VGRDSMAWNHLRTTYDTAYAARMRQRRCSRGSRWKDCTARALARARGGRCRAKDGGGRRGRARGDAAERGPAAASLMITHRYVRGRNPPVHRRPPALSPYVQTLVVRQRRGDALQHWAEGDVHQAELGAQEVGALGNGQGWTGVVEVDEEGRGPRHRVVCVGFVRS